MYVQNQRGVGKAAKRWDRSGVILENKGFDKYSVKIDGSGRVSDRNRKYLKAFTPDKLNKLRGPSHQEPGDQTEEVFQPSPQTHDVSTPDVAPLPMPPSPQTQDVVTPQDVSTPDVEPSPIPIARSVGGQETHEPVLRRSSRVRKSNVCYPKEEYDLS